MSWWRTFVRWLARHELEAADRAVQAANHAAYSAAVGAEIREKGAYAEGQLFGRQEMYDYIDKMVGERMGRVQDFVMPEDLARAKKWMLH